jgi:YD repeat-containing protein
MLGVFAALWVTYAKTGNVLTLTGPNGLTTTWEYDALGRQAKETRAQNTFVQFQSMARMLA